MLKHQGALLMRGTPNQRMAVAERAIVLREMEMKVIVRPPREEAIIQDTTAKVAINPAKVTNLVKVVTSPVQDITAKVAINPAKDTSLVKVDIVLASIVKAVLSLVKVAISLVLVTIAKAAASPARVATSPVRVGTPAALVLPAIILMLSTA